LSNFHGQAKTKSGIIQPDITLKHIKQPLMDKQPELELQFSDNTYQLTGVAISKQGRLFTNYPL